MFVSTIFLLSLSLTQPCLAWFHFGHEDGYNQQKQQNLPEGVQSTDLRMPGVRLEKNDTYLCTAFPLDSDEEHYISERNKLIIIYFKNNCFYKYMYLYFSVSFEPLANQHQIHHMLLFGCEMPGSDEPAW